MWYSGDSNYSLLRATYCFLRSFLTRLNNMSVLAKANIFKWYVFMKGLLLSRLCVWRSWLISFCLFCNMTIDKSELLKQDSFKNTGVPKSPSSYRVWFPISAGFQRNWNFSISNILLTSKFFSKNPQINESSKMTNYFFNKTHESVAF